ncbi:hypothetical protein SISNIDRAFT_460750 [Sistotremastrum niveocremeum HHB9708]|uniref:F-box domain-containing protein n=1 Tax=Sistotremastrum niveocremeum HHB9708 TaxID=1314777 RepID=A0A164NFT6_9AGAM|nr:hypothetical protein SISNIDRAFT_460750 [Sistotremastrum niveocremeum HHB9708]
MTGQFVTLPLDVFAEIAAWLVGLGDLVHLAQTCSRIWNLSLTSRQYWSETPEIVAIALPTGHPLSTVPVDQIYALAARATSLQSTPLQELMIPKRQSCYEPNGVGHNVEFLHSPANSWYLDHCGNTVTIRRAEKGWDDIFCDTGFPSNHHSFIGPAAGQGMLWVGFIQKRLVEGPSPESPLFWEFTGFKLRFPNERGPPTAPTVEEKIRIELPKFPAIHNIQLNDSMFFALSQDRHSIQLVDLTNRSGVNLRLRKYMTNWALVGRDSPISFTIVIESARFFIYISGTDRETLDFRSQYYIANFPANGKTDSNCNALTSSGITWRNDVLDVTHSYELPEHPQQLPPLPPILPEGAVRLSILRSGSFYLHEDRILAFETDENDLQRIKDFPCFFGGPSETGDFLCRPNQISLAGPRNSIHKGVRLYRFAPPDDIPDDHKYSVDAFDHHNLMAFIAVIGRRGGEQSRKLYKVIY